MKTRRVLCFSLRTMLVVVLALSAWLGWMANKAAKQRRVVALVQELGGSVIYDGQVGKTLIKSDFVTALGVLSPSPRTSVVYEPLPERLLYDLLGVDWFHDVVQVRLVGPAVNDEQLGNVVDGLPFISKLYLHDCPITETGIKHLASLERHAVVDLGGTNATADFASRLRRHHPGLILFHGP